MVSKTDIAFALGFMAASQNKERKPIKDKQFIRRCGKDLSQNMFKSWLNGYDQGSLEQMESMLNYIKSKS